MFSFCRVGTLGLALFLTLVIGQIGILMPAYAAAGHAMDASYYRVRGGLPPGLEKAWAHSNMSVVAIAVTEAIFLGGYHGVELASMAIAASSNGQMIRNVAYNETVVQVRFDKDGFCTLIINSSAKPAAVYADDIALSEMQSTAGLTPQNEAWVYDETHQNITIFADPSTVTIFYGSAPVPEFPLASISLLLLVTITAAIAMSALRRSAISAPSLENKAKRTSVQGAP